MPIPEVFSNNYLLLFERNRMVGKEPITKTNTGRTANDTPNQSEYF